MADGAIDKKKIENVKLLLSSLFARKQKYLIVDGNHKNRMIYTNFPYERTIYYRSTPEDSICGVTINDELVPLIHEAFPVFEQVVAEIELLPFMSAVNKCLSAEKTKWPEITVNKETEKIIITLPTADEAGNKQSVEVGRLLPPDALDYYEGIMNQFQKFTKIPFELDLNIPTDHFNDPLIFADLPIPIEKPVTIRLPVQDGFSMVSFKEYLKKRNLPVKYRALVHYKPDSQAAKVALKYEDDWLSCLSMMPGTVWFPFI